MRIKRKQSSAILAMIVGSLGLMLSLLQLIDDKFVFAVLTLLLLGYLWYEVVQIRRDYPKHWLLHPAVICSVMFFFMGYGGTNVLFFLPPAAFDYLGLVPEVSPAMVTHQYLVLLGAFTLFLGYSSPLAIHFTRPHMVERFQNRFFPGTDVLKEWAIPVLVLVGFSARLFAIRLGLFGYGGDYSAERLAETSGYSQFLVMAGSLSTLALLLAALRYFTTPSPKNASFWFWVILLDEIFFGFLSGMKSSVVMPLVIVGFAFYLQRGIISKKLIILAIASLVVAYAVVEPFRVLRNKRGGSLTSVSSIVDLVEVGFKGNSSSTSEEGGAGAFITSFAARSNLSYIGSFGIEYADTYEKLPPGSPEFLNNIFLAPLHALVPRFIWNSKPLGNLGLWYNQQVMGRSHFSSTGMGPFTYLYFAGGYVAVGIAFFIFGVFQRMLFFLFSPSGRKAGVVIYLTMLPSLAIIDSSVNGILISIFRLVPLLLICTQLLFRR